MFLDCVEGGCVRTSVAPALGVMEKMVPTESRKGWGGENGGSLLQLNELMDTETVGVLGEEQSNFYQRKVGQDKKLRKYEQWLRQPYSRGRHSS